MAKNYYRMLGLPQTATDTEIRQRFKEMARERHPDRFQGTAKERAEREFQLLTEAFNVLISPERRRVHDLDLNRKASPSAPRPAASKTAAGSSDAPTPPDPAELLRAYMSRGVAAFRQGNFPQAVDNFQRATDADPESAKAWYHLALAASQGRRWQPKALQAAERAAKLEPMKPSYLKLAGKVFAQAGEDERALQYYRQARSWGDDDEALQEAIEALEGKAKKGGLGGLFGRIG